MSERPGKPDWVDYLELIEGGAMLGKQPENDTMPESKTYPQDVIDLRCSVNPALKDKVDQLRGLGVDLDPVKNRILSEADADILDVIFHFREYIFFVLKAYDIAMHGANHGVQLCHAQASLRDMASIFAANAVSSNDEKTIKEIRSKLQTIYDWLCCEERNARVLREYIASCK